MYKKLHKVKILKKNTYQKNLCILDKLKMVEHNYPLQLSTSAPRKQYTYKYHCLVESFFLQLN